MMAGHSSSSRPDITIRLQAAGRNELVFVESKLPSIQGHDQLQRYADHLAAEFQSKGLSKASLVFITRDYEKSEPPTVRDSAFQPAFVPTRWFQFYRQLKVHVNGDGLARELKLFMEEHRMSLGNQFRSTDVVAMENFLSARALMNETLDGEVADQAQRILGSVDASARTSDKQLRDHGRYIITNANWNTILCMIGYWLPQDSPDDRVWVGITMESKPSAEGRSEVLGAFREWSQRRDRGWTLEDDQSWSPMYKGKDLQCFMAEQDQVRAIKNYLIELLNEVGEFKKEFPTVPWT